MLGIQPLPSDPASTSKGISCSCCRVGRVLFLRLLPPKTRLPRFMFLSKQTAKHLPWPSMIYIDIEDVNCDVAYEMTLEIWHIKCKSLFSSPPHLPFITEPHCFVICCRQNYTHVSEQFNSLLIGIHAQLQGSWDKKWWWLWWWYGDTVPINHILEYSLILYWSDMTNFNVQDAQPCCMYCLFALTDSHHFPHHSVFILLLIWPFSGYK